MSQTAPAAKLEPKAEILALLQENLVMCVATVRPDGWPQATMVGYVHDDLTLYFAVARISQKLANIQREPRVSIALGHQTPNRLRGLSMAARAAEVTDLAEIEHLNALMRERYPDQTVFSPREISSAVVRVSPTVVSIIDLPRGPGEPELVEVGGGTLTHHLQNTAAFPGGAAVGGKTVTVQFARASPDRYRPGAPL
jgi:nitroimidazol reductase NimA-like FMN-containing flavoprotein (pyridoxamine 5'-phosphate oxidase superfamily)